MIAVDLAKRVFQVHAVDDTGAAVVRRKLRRSEMASYFAGLKPTIVGMETCSGANYWGRMLEQQGHQVRLVPPNYVKPFVQRHKNDMADAAAICEAMARPTMRFAPVKTLEQQATQTAIRARQLLVRQRTMTINALRGHLAEFGIVGATGPQHVPKLVERLSMAGPEVPEYARFALQALIDQISTCSDRIAELETAIVARCRSDRRASQLMSVPGVGPLTAASIMAAAPDPARFRSGRHFAAWLGLVPKQHSTGGQPKLGRVSKMGDRTLRRLLISGGLSVILATRRRPAAPDTWLGRLIARKPILVAATAVANKNARILWAILSGSGPYRASAVHEVARP
jgi:transposase